MDHSEFLNKEENEWMKSVMQVVRKTSVFFQPQIRTKIMNEGWASYWHETLFLQDDRIKSHEVEFARVNAGVTSMPRVGLNPYALGMRMFYYIEDMVNKGKHSFDFQKVLDQNRRKDFDAKTGKGREFIFKIRENFCDFMFISTFVDQDFVTLNNLFVAGQRLNQAKMVWEYYVKSRKAEEYRKMLMDSLYHPPYIEVPVEKNTSKTLYLRHNFEEKPLVAEFIANTMMGIEYLWGWPVQLETHEVFSMSPPAGPQEVQKEPEIEWQQILYTMENRKISKRALGKMKK
jgi:stage V sporulation protein R